MSLLTFFPIDNVFFVYLDAFFKLPFLSTFKTTRKIWKQQLNRQHQSRWCNKEKATKVVTTQVILVILTSYKAWIFLKHIERNLFCNLQIARNVKNIMIPQPIFTGSCWSPFILFDLYIFSLWRYTLKVSLKEC